MRIPLNQPSCPNDVASRAPWVTTSISGDDSKKKINPVDDTRRKANPPYQTKSTRRRPKRARQTTTQ